jgi:Predicted periplasmic or secreted lipoprotein
VAKDFEDNSGLENLSDGEMRSLIRERLDEQVSFDPADVEVEVNRGVVRLTGRVGTDNELRIVEHLLTDVVGVSRVENDIYVDTIRRAESPIAIDDHLADEEAHEGLLLGDRPRSESPEAERLVEDPEAERDGTTDVGEAISEGIPWNPPNSPTPEGLRGTDVIPDTGGEQH